MFVATLIPNMLVKMNPQTLAITVPVFLCDLLENTLKIKKVTKKVANL